MSDKTRFAKLSREQWIEVEKKYDNPITQIVLGAMAKLGGVSNVMINRDNVTTIAGEEVYLIFRGKLVEAGLVEGSDTTVQIKKHVGKKMTKAEIIRNNILEKYGKSLTDVLATFGFIKMCSVYGFRSQFAEIRIVTLIYCAKFLLQKDNCEGAMYELIVGIDKVSKIIDELGGISMSCIDDLCRILIKLKAKSDFGYEVLFKKYPRLAVMTEYDRVFPIMTVKPYTSQINVMNEVKKGDALLLYRAMIGSGKTTLSIALAKYVESIRAAKRNGLQLIFACSVEPVRHQVCRMAYNQQVAFGVAVVVDGILRVINNFSSKGDKERVLIVADLDATIELLKRDQNYILFVDEPTVGADQVGHPITKAICMVLKLCPSKTILSSATLPHIDEIMPVIEYIKNRHLNAKIVEICSKESFIGCQVNNFNGKIILPHSNCRTHSELLEVIRNVEEKPFIDRMYSPSVLFRFKERMIQSGLKGVDFDEYFEKCSNLMQKSVQDCALLMLRELIGYEDSVIEKVCSEMRDDAINLKLLLTEHAHRFVGGCLVAVCDPLEVAYSLSLELLKECESATKIIGKFQYEMEKFKQGVMKFDSVKNDVERSKMQQNMESNKKPCLDFPLHLKVNSLEHYKHFTKEKSAKNLAMSKEIDLEALPLDLCVQDWVQLLLFAGVGIYTTGGKGLNTRYTRLVLNLLAEGKLNILISDSGICYGANYPFSHVIIEEKLAMMHSIGTVFQLIGRAGRVGESWIANAYIGDQTEKRIMNYILGYDSKSIEAENINAAFLQSKSNKIQNDHIIKISEVTEINQPSNFSIHPKKNTIISKPVDTWESLDM